MSAKGQALLTTLVMLNVALQIADGTSTYLGLTAGVPEGNPLLRQAMQSIGILPALLAFKLQACACLLVVWRLRASRIAIPALGFTAATYLTFAVGPWLSVLARIYL